jgi:hypothetical protein
MRMRLREIVGMGFVLALAAAVSPTVVEAQCQNCMDGEWQGEDAHQFGGFLGSDRVCDPSCHSVPVVGHCWEFHEGCQTEDAQEELLASISDGDPAMLKEALEEYSEVVQVNLEEGTFAIPICGHEGEFIKIPMPDWFDVGLAAGL